MKVINETKHEINIAHPSITRAVLGGLFVLVSAALFLLSAVKSSAALFESHVAYGLFIVGVFILFVNNEVTIDINRKSGDITHRQRKFVRTDIKKYALDNVSHIEVRHKQGGGSTQFGDENASDVPTQPYAAESFLIFQDGSELQIDRGKKTSRVSVHESDDVASLSTADRVAGFLGVPVHNKIEPN